MPDRTQSADANPPVTVTVGGGAGPGGVERRTDRQAPSDTSSVGQQIVIQQPTPTDQVLLHGIPLKLQGWVRLGTVGVLVGIAVLLLWDNRQHNRRLEEREVQRFAEMVELQRAREGQQDRRHDAIMSEMRALVSKVDASMDRLTSAGNEVRTTRVTMEQVVTKMEEVLNRLFAELKRLVPAPRKPLDKPGDKKGEPTALEFEGATSWENPIFGLFDHSPPKAMPAEPELAPHPRRVSFGDTAGGAR
jgi:hypothetical protein